MVHTGLDEAALQDRFHLATARTSNFGKPPCDAASLLRIEVDRLRDTHGAAPLVVIDTVASVSAQMNENDASSVGPFLKACQTIVGQRGDPPATVLLVHHGAKHNGASPRGHSKFTGNPDVVIAARHRKGGLVLEVQKQRYAAAPPARSFKMAPVELETGDDALVLVDAAQGAAPPATAAQTAETRTVETTSGVRPAAGGDRADELLMEILRDGLAGSEPTTMTLKAIHAAYERAARSRGIAAISKPTVLRRLRELVRRGLVAHVAGARGGAYRLKR